MANSLYKIVNNKQVYPQKPNGDEYTLNKTYALNANNKPYYPRNADRTCYFIIHIDRVPLFLKRRNIVWFVNIQREQDESHYMAKPNEVGFLYKMVMSQVSTDLTDMYYPAWQKGGLTVDLFRVYKSFYDLIKWENGKLVYYDIQVYVRSNEYFTFHGDKEIAIHFDSVNKVHYKKNDTIYFEPYIDGSDLHYILVDNKHKLYFKDDKGILADGFIFYVPFHQTQQVQILGTHKTVTLPTPFGQDIDTNGSIYCYTIDSNSDREYFFTYGARDNDPTEKIRFFDYDIYRMLRYEYTWDNGLKKYLPGEEPYEDVSSTHDLNANYVEVNGRQIYPKHKGSEFIYERLGYARDENQKFYYPTHADGRIMIFSGASSRPRFINPEDEPEDMNDLDFYYDKIYFMGNTYYLPVPDEIIEKKIQDANDRRQRLKDLIKKNSGLDDEPSGTLNRPVETVKITPIYPKNSNPGSSVVTLRHPNKTITPTIYPNQLSKVQSFNTKPIKYIIIVICIIIMLFGIKLLK